MQYANEREKKKFFFDFEFVKKDGRRFCFEGMTFELGGKSSGYNLSGYRTEGRQRSRGNFSVQKAKLMQNASSGTDRFRAILVLTATLGTVAFNWLAATGNISGVTPYVISDRYPTILTPADYAFSIWSLIYLGLIAFSVFQLFPANFVRFRPIRSLYILSCVFNCAWIYFFHHDQIGVCMAVILLLWATLLLIKINLAGCATMAETWLMQAPFGIYFGWVTAAALVNFMVFLKYLDSPAASSSVLGSALILVAAGCAIVVRLKLWNFFYPLAIAWALTAIAVKQSGNTAIVAFAALGVVVCLVTTGSFVVLLRDSTSE